MNKGIRFLAAASVVTAFGAMAEVPAGYYSSLEGKSGAELKKAVKALVADHEAIPYGEADPNNPFNPVEVATWTVFAVSDVRVVDGKTIWWDMYSPNLNLVSEGHAPLNIEHSVANSWWGGKNGNPTAYCDLHHLVPSDAITNNKKSDVPLGIVEKATLDNGVTKVGSPKSGTCGGANTVFEPADVYKGDFARNYFYIFTVYDDISWNPDCTGAVMFDTSSPLTLKPWAYEMLLQWATDDPVSHKETDRNDVIYGYQKNRNPFIDCPDLADHIWGSKQNEPFKYTPYTPGEDPEYPLNETFTTPGYWRPITSDEELNEDDYYFIIAPSEKKAMTYTQISNMMDVCAGYVEYDMTDYPDVATAVPEDVAYIRLEEGNGGWYVGVYDPEENFKGYISTTSKNTARLNTSKGNGTLATITVTADRTSIVYNVSGTDYTLQYNSSSPRFASYASNQKPIRLYRVTDEFDNLPGPDAGVVGPADEEQSLIGIFDINGRKLNANSESELGKGIYIIVTTSGAKKIIR